MIPSLYKSLRLSKGRTSQPGLIDDDRLYSYALTDDEVTVLYKDSIATSAEKTEAEER